MNRLLSASLLSVLATISSNALAGPRSFNFPGALCTTADPGKTVFYNQFGVFNNSGGAITVECPLPTTTINATTDLQTVTASVYDRSTSSDVTCTLSQTGFDGNLIFSTTAHTTGGGPTSGNVALSLGNPPGVLNGYWSVRCTLPATEFGAQSYMTAVLFTAVE
jgi:hypothetical protein